MTEIRYKLWWWAAIIFSTLNGCANIPPSQEMSDARQLVQAALDSGAENYFPLLMEQITVQIATAEQQLAAANYPAARQQALIIKNDAARARTMTRILIATLETLSRAEKITRISPHIREIFDQALRGARNGDEAAALVLADQARQEAERALDDYYLNYIFAK